MVDLDREHVGLDLVVVRRQAVEILRIDFWRGIDIGTHRIGCGGRGRIVRAHITWQADGRHAAVRHVVLVDVQEAGGDAGRFAQAKGDRWGDRPALVLDFVARRIAAVLFQQVQAEGGTRVGVDHAVPVGGGAFLLAAADGDQGIDAVFQVRRLADQVDRAGRRTTAAVGAGRAFQHVDLFDVEHVARDRADVAHAVDVDAARGVKAAHVDRVARIRVAIFAEEEGTHAWRVAQRVGQGQSALLLDQFFLDHDDGLRRIDQRFRVFRRRGLVGLEVVFLGANDGHFFQHLLRCRCALAGRVCGLGGDGQQHDGQGGADMLVEAGLDVLAALDCHLALSLWSG